ncbi:UNKNOWN [Stylonychia lemnae]|uniref:Uncharacterized protein n=1 Tax=Stylonychia lemnae TaxID=5949 RepID=A0A078A471_STYLE|nr:UNKNOWN [Stylonychia lemnae]|eukprot:CDW76947.1 UNKNOWN [Stylonychia lemnae]
MMDFENPQPSTYDEMHPAITQLFSYQSMLCANENLNNNFIQNYRKKYLGPSMQLTTEEVLQTHPMTDAQINQKIVWNDIPGGNLNYFQSHRFFVVKGFLTCSQLQMVSNNVNNNNYNSNLNLYEYVDIQKEMGEFLPAEIQNIINNQSQFDVQDWLCKKMFARPMNQISGRNKNNKNAINS